MISHDAVAATIATYEKHGWILRRVLLSEKTLAGRVDDLFGDVEVRRSSFDAAWFSRPPKPGETAWELRYLDDIAYALLEYVDEASLEFEADLANVESRMAESITKKHRA
ncbi:MAG: hypothetical protein KBD94_11530 [Pyrinomonadaceae bacterium]|nr:hypothetical protein [Pyrinomonadaceae bacterium]